MTTPFPFVSGAVLTAAQMNDITNLPINDQTASYTLVVGDAGKRVVMDVATANTVTVDDSVFTTGDTIFVANKGAGASTLTAGAGVTINSASGLVLVAHQSGQLVALSASSFLFVPSAGPASAAGLTFITGSTFTAAAGFSLPNDTFTATFDNYKLIVDVTAISATALFTMRLRAGGSDNTVANYNTMFFGGNSAGEAFSEGGSDLSAFNVLGCSTTFPLYALDVDVISPFLVRHTDLAGSIIGSTATVFASMGGGATFRGTTSFDSLSLIVAGGATITGNFRVYGYANS